MPSVKNHAECNGLIISAGHRMPQPYTYQVNIRQVEPHLQVIDRELHRPNKHVGLHSYTMRASNVISPHGKPCMMKQRQ